MFTPLCVSHTARAVNHPVHVLLSYTVYPLLVPKRVLEVVKETPCQLEHKYAVVVPPWPLLLSQPLYMRSHVGVDANSK